MHVLSSDAFDVTPLEGLPGVAFTWKEPASSPAIREAYSELLSYMKANNLPYLLLDLRLRGRASFADEQWMTQVFFPSLLEKFSVIYFATVLAPAHYNTLRLESINGNMGNLSSLLRMHHFLSPTAAVEWLHSQQEPFTIP
ncbi:hypothetical protein BH24BAC1_BH24BAC1_18320 [soil metagenome]|jgi:hypothetical protein